VGAPPQRQGEWRGHRPDKGRDLDRLGALCFAVLDLAQPMARAVLDGARALVGAAIASDAQTAGQPGLAEHLLGAAGRPGLTEEKQAERRGGEPPGLALVPSGPPAGVVGMVDGRLAVFLPQPLGHAGQHAGPAVEDLHPTAWAQPRLVAHVA
jgi:hypothetical protein